MLVSVNIKIRVLLWTARCKRPGCDGHRMDQAEHAGRVEAASGNKKPLSGLEIPASVQSKCRSLTLIYAW